MPNYKNIKDKGFDCRSKSELQEICKKGGERSGEVRRRKADFKKTLNWLLTTELKESNWSVMLENMGIDSTVESAINAVMIQKALEGNVRAYEVIAKIAGQDSKNEAWVDRIRAEVKKLNIEIKKEVSSEHIEDKVADLFSAINKALDDEPVCI